MFKIMFVATLEESLETNFDLLPESFEAAEEARQFLMATVIPEQFDCDFEDDTDMDYDYEIEDYGAHVVVNLYYRDELESITEYKIVKI